MRTLIVIPIIHTAHDMGSLLDQVREQYVSRYGHEQWTEHLKSIDEVWVGIRQLIADLELPYANVRLYQDGIPICGKEADIITELAARGSPNHLLLMQLMERGAHLMGTEDPQLLRQEYQLIRSNLDGGEVSAEVRQQREGLGKKLLEDRDRFIGGRVNATLSSGEIGLLFLGMAHAVEAFLDANILVRHLIPSRGELGAAKNDV